MSQDVLTEYESSSYCWDSIENICEENTRKILNETDLILNNSFDVGQNIFSLQIDLSYARDVEPAIKLVKKSDGAKISFCEIEWDDLMQQLRKFDESYFDKNLDPETTSVLMESSEKIKIHPSSFLNAKLLMIKSLLQNQECFYLSEVFGREFIKMSGTVIKNRIFMLKKMNFFSFYRNFL